MTIGYLDEIFDRIFTPVFLNVDNHGYFRLGALSSKFASAVCGGIVVDPKERQAARGAKKMHCAFRNDEGLSKDSLATKCMAENPFNEERNHRP